MTEFTHPTRFLDGHRQCIANAAGADWNIITTVPSSQEREGEHPLERVVRMARALTDEYEALLEPGPGEIGHNRRPRRRLHRHARR